MALGDLVASLAADPGAAGADAIKQRQLLAQKLMEQGGSTAPIQSPWQGVANLVKGLQGGFEGYMADKQQKDWTQSGNDVFAKALAPQASVAATPANADTPSLPAFAGGSADMSMPRGLRNNNPGNIEDGSFAQSQPGYAGSDGRFAKFDSLDNGVGAHSSLLASYGNKGINTIAGIVNRWAPSGDGANDPNGYAATVAKDVGVDPNAPLDMSDAGLRQRLALAMGKVENGRPIQVASANPTQAMSYAAPGATAPAATAASAAVTPSGPITVPGYDGKFTRDQANDAEGVPSQAEWDAASKAAGTGAVAASVPPQAAAAAPVAPKAAVDPQGARLLAAMADPHITPAQRQVLGLMYANTQKSDQWSAPAKDADGNLISRNTQTGETKVLVSGKDTNKTHVVNGALVDDTGKVIYKGGDESVPDAKMIDFAASRLLAGDSSALTNLGRGAQSGKVVQQILKRAQEISESKGMNNETAAQDILQKKADQMGRGAAARTGGTLNARMDVFSAEADAAMNLALDTSRNLPRTSFLPLNKAIQTLEKGAGSPELAQHVAQTNAVINTYAKAINPTGVPTQSDKDHAREQLNAAQSPEAYEATIRQMQREINVAHRAARSVKDLGGADIPPPPATTTPSGEPGAQSHGLGEMLFGGGKTAAPSAAAPAVGEVRKGYRFKGGDPSQQESWEKVGVSM